MVEGIARIKYLRISAKKAKLIMDLIRGKNVIEAERILLLTPKKAARLAYKALKSALDSYEKKAKENALPKERLYVKVAKADKGPEWWLLRPGFRGVPAFARRKTSHFTIIIGERE
ncbi:MAG: uL22 family ribosomal protein [candidate division WOR-3 bacterium]